MPAEKVHPAKKKPRRLSHKMATEKAHARSAAIRQDSEDVSDASSRSDHDSESASDSDSLDSYASRKRRKVSPRVDELLVPVSSVPSRIKSKIQSNAVNNQT